MGISINTVQISDQNQADSTFTNDIRNGEVDMRELISSLQALLIKSDLDSSGIVVSKITERISNNSITDNKILSDSYYLIGIYYLLTGNYSGSVRYLKKSAGLKESMKEFDARLAKTLYNLGVAYNGLGDFSNQENYSLNSLEVEK